jgi:hypothetical protein
LITGLAGDLTGALEVFGEEGFAPLIFLTTGAGFFGTTFAAGFLTGADLEPFEGALVALVGMAFLTGALDFVVFPEGFRAGEGLVDFFNGTELVPDSRARKDR